MEPGPALPQPGGGSELREPFTGAIRFNQVRVSGNLPQHAALASGQTYTYTVTVDNTGLAPEAFIADPRLNQQATIALPDQNGGETNMSLLLPPGLTFPLCLVPTHTRQLQESLTGTVPVNFDTSYLSGDPDVEGFPRGTRPA